MKILVLGTRGFPNIQGGVESHCENLYPHIVKAGCEVVVMARKPYLHLDATYFYKGIKIVPVNCPKNKFLEAFLHTFFGLCAAKKVKPDIVHIHAIGPALLTPLARIMGFKVVTTNHGPDYKRQKWGGLAKFILKTGEFLGSKYANKTIAISEYIGKNLNKKYKKEPAVIPNGVTLKEINNSEEILKKFNLEKNKYILTVGRFVPEKGFIDLIDAFEKANLTGYKLVIVGNADHENKYSLELKEKAKQAKNVILTGFLTGADLEQIYSHAGIFILPSYYEGLPIVLLEGLSYGLSCLVSNIEAHQQVKISKNRFFNPGNIEEIAAKINEFVNKPLSEEEKKEQIRLVSDNYDWKKIAQQTLSVYYSVAK